MKEKSFNSTKAVNCSYFSILLTVHFSNSLWWVEVISPCLFFINKSHWRYDNYTFHGKQKYTIIIISISLLYMRILNQRGELAHFVLFKIFFLPLWNAERYSMLFPSITELRVTWFKAGHKTRDFDLCFGREDGRISLSLPNREQESELNMT